MSITADQVADVRAAIGDTQADFAKRFRRSRYSIIRWEQSGTHFSYRTEPWELWQCAVSEALHQCILKGNDAHEKNLRPLRVFQN